MKAAIYNGVKDVSIKNIPEPVCGSSDIIVKTVRSGICGSDITGYYFGGQYVGIDVGAQFGHEVGARVVEVGSKVEGIKEGDKVFVNPTFAIEPGKQDMLGGFSEYIRVPNAKVNHSVYVLSDAVTFEEVALIEPMSVGIRGKNRPGAKAGDHVIVYGAGFIGSACAASLICQDIKPLVYEPISSRREFPTKIGATVREIGLDNEEDFLKNLFGIATSRIGYPIPDVDICVDCCGATSIPNDFIKMAKPGARLSMLGIPHEEVPVDTLRLVTTEGIMLGSCAYDPADIVEVIGILEGKKVQMSDLITHHFGLEDINEAFAVTGDRDTCIKVMIDME
jgi:2-desacetyl-2-hydroxyethyl bacteriochlorophyllide A dehydrogenase